MPRWTHAVRIVLPVLQLDKSRRVELEIVDMDLLGRTWDFGFIRFRTTPNFHIVSVILVDRVIALSLSLCRLDPERVALLLHISALALPPHPRAHVLTFPAKSSPSQVWTILSDLKLLSASRSSPAYFELISAVFSSPRLMISSISSSIIILPVSRKILASEIDRLTCWSC
jgi:hypothetical protein